MKNVKLLFVLFCALILYGCGCNQYPVAYSGNQYEYLQDPYGNPYVRCYDNGIWFVVSMMEFNRLGYGGCVSYYHSHPNFYPRYTNSAYGSWRNTGRSVPSYHPVSPQRSTPGYRPANTPPSRPAYRPSSTTPSRPSYRPSGGGSSRPSYRPSGRH